MTSYSDIFKALSDTTRLAVVLYLNDGRGEHSCSEVSAHFKLAQPTMCHHFKVLKGAGIIHSRKIGTTVLYSLDKDSLGRAGIDLNQIHLAEVMETVA